MEMTTPLECLFVSMDHMDHSDEVTHILFELKQHLSEIKNIFLDSRISRSILTQLEKLLNKSTPLSHNEKHCLLNCITLMRNVLHIPENASSSNSNGYVFEIRTRRQNNRSLRDYKNRLAYLTLVR